jgi:hypothetical protein
MTAYERRESGTLAGRDNRALRRADVRDRGREPSLCGIAQHRDDRRDWCGQHDEIAIGEIADRRALVVDHTAPAGRVCDLRAIDAADRDVGPFLAQTERNRSADEPESDNADACGAPDAGVRHGAQRLQPRRATDSTQMLRPIAGAMMRSSAMSWSNCAGNIDCAPSDRA